MRKDPRVYLAQILERAERILQYEGVNVEEVWRILERELPELRRTISTFLPPLDELEREISGEPEPR